MIKNAEQNNPNDQLNDQPSNKGGPAEPDRAVPVGGAQMPDPRPGFTLATSQAKAIIEAVDRAAKTNQASLRLPTPCDNYDVGQVAAHLVAVVQRITAVARGLDPFSVPQEIAGLEPVGFGAAWSEAVASQEEVWSDDAVLAQSLVLPFATLPGAIALAIYVSEVVVHTWDLACGLGLEVDWNETLCEGALATVQFGIPDQPRGGEIPFAAVVEIASNAPAIDRLVAWLGRQP